MGGGFTYGQWSAVYNALSFGIAGMGSATIFFWLQLGNLTKNYRTALIITWVVTAIATYHYVRIFNSWVSAFEVKNSDGSDYAVHMGGTPFNDAYRYVDWLLTVPLLLIELILVMKLPRAETVALSWNLGVASAGATVGNVKRMLHLLKQERTAHSGNKKLWSHLLNVVKQDSSLLRPFVHSQSHHLDTSLIKDARLHPRYKDNLGDFVHFAFYEIGTHRLHDQILNLFWLHAAVRCDLSKAQPALLDVTILRFQRSDLPKCELHQS